MRKPRTPPCLAESMLLAWFLLIHAGCATGTSSSADSTDWPNSSEVPFPNGMLLTFPGDLDDENKFLPAVNVASLISDPGNRRHRKPCSGVLIHRRLVITAGHCVCLERAATREEQVQSRTTANPTAKQRTDVLTRSQALEGFTTITGIIDKKAPCAQTTTIIATVYSEENGQRMRREFPYTGRIVLHDRFEIVMGVRRGTRDTSSPRPGVNFEPTLAWSNADLAAILLDTPVTQDFQPLKLAGGEVKPGDRIIIVGYAAGDSPLIHGDRQSGENMVTRLIRLETGSSLIRTDLQTLPEGGRASYAEPGDSGGACLQKANQSVLVGFVTAGARRADGGPMSYFTSVYSHRAWLEQLIKEADKS